MSNIKFVAIRCVLSSSKCTKTYFRPVGTPLGELRTLLQTLSSAREVASPSPSTPTFRACSASVQTKGVPSAYTYGQITWSSGVEGCGRRSIARVTGGVWSVVTGHWSVNGHTGHY